MNNCGLLLIRITLGLTLMAALVLQPNSKCLAESSVADMEMAGDFRTAAYTSSFAKRFGLPVLEKSSETTDGIVALEFAIEKGDNSPYYFWVFYIYLDDRLPIKYPETNISGERNMLQAGSHFFGRDRKLLSAWDKTDRLYLNNAHDNYDRKANLASMNYEPNKKGFITDLYYKEYRKSILRGLSYIKLQCPLSMTVINSSEQQIGIWLQKDGNTNYGTRIHVAPDDFIKFKLPMDVKEKMVKWSAKVKAYNDKLLPYNSQK